MKMQGSDLKAIRQQLGMSQSEFADALDMTGTFVGMMERGDRPIEHRTALAARQLLNERHPTYGHRPLERRDGDVTLAEMVLLWEPDDPSMPPVKVLGGGQNDSHYTSSFGADSMDWPVLDNVGRLLRLFTRFHELVMAHGIAPQAVHDALLAIPEYRQAVELSTVPIEMRPES